MLFKREFFPNNESISGGARDAVDKSDKVFQHNGPSRIEINDFQAENFGKLSRSCGNCKKQFHREIKLDNAKLSGCKYIAGINGKYTKPL